VGKRSGEGFVAHKVTLVNALSRALADRLLLMDFTMGRKGLLGYIKALSGSNIVKIVPATNGSAGEAQAAAKRLKVVCGANTSYLEDSAWIGDNTPVTLAEVRISPNNSVKPNIGRVKFTLPCGIRHSQVYSSLESTQCLIWTGFSLSLVSLGWWPS
jgi:DNA polymerase-3 subunit beta